MNEYLLFVVPAMWRAVTHKYRRFIKPKFVCVLEPAVCYFQDNGEGVGVSFIHGFYEPAETRK